MYMRAECADNVLSPTHPIQLIQMKTKTNIPKETSLRVEAKTDSW